MFRFLACTVLCLVCAWPAPASAQESPLMPELGRTQDQEMVNRRLQVFQDNVVETGLGYERIPAIDRPAFINVPDASLALDDADQVFVLEGDPVRVYPQTVLVWHEVVNDVVNGAPVSITYCPLTGSVMGYQGGVDLYETTFGTTGRLVNNNTVLYDRSTNSFWPQILGQSIEGPLMGERLVPVPLVWTSWKLVKQVYPDALVLSNDTGFRRTYGSDPYGSYARGGTYYQNDMVVYPLTTADDRMPPKERILGLLAGDMAVAVLEYEVRSAKVINFEAGITPMVAFWDPQLETVRIFERGGGARALTFALDGDVIYDKETHTQWNPRGRATDGALDGDRLEPVAFMPCMWFAWAAFHPDTRVVPGDESF